MTAARSIWLALPCLAFAAPTAAQPVDFPLLPAASSDLPPGVSIKRTSSGPIYVDAQGRTLYGLDFRTLELRTGEPHKFCSDECKKMWEPMAPPPGTPLAAYPPPRQGGGGGGGRQLPPAIPGAKPTDWVAIQAADGPQWLFKQWHLVFTRRGDKPGSTEWDGSDDFTWNTLKYVPPVPQLPLPPTVAPLFKDGAYVLAAKDGRLLYSFPQAKSCAATCREAEVFPSSMLSQGMGDWKVLQNADSSQWAYRGQPVFVSRSADASSIPAGAQLLRP